MRVNVWKDVPRVVRAQEEMLVMINILVNTVF